MNAGVSHFEMFGDEPEQLADLYRELFGWRIEQAPGVDYWRVQSGDGQMVGGLGYLLNGQKLTYLGYEVLPLNEMPRNCVLFTPLLNLVYGINTNMERYREVKGEERCISYTFDSAFDFQVAVDDAAVIAHKP